MTRASDHDDAIAPNPTATADRIADAEGRMYHIGLAPGEVAPYVLLVGDPKRADRVAERFDAVACTRTNREYVTHTGTYRGLRLSVMGTGMGTGNMEIAVVELCQVVEAPTLLRCGTSGSLQPHVDLGHLVVTTGAVRLEDTSTAFVDPGFPAVAHHEVVGALLWACADAGHPHHVGISATAAGFYGAQERRVPGFAPRLSGRLDALAAQNVLNLEMEISTLLSLAAYRGLRAGAVCGILANRPAGTFVSFEGKEETERRAIDVALDAFVRLARIDAAKGDAPHFHPGMAVSEA